METTLRLVFEGSSNRKVNFSFPLADSTAPAAQVKTLMQIIATNGEIFAVRPMSPLGAEFVSREVKPINIS